jgi:hypothetical protein
MDGIGTYESQGGFTMPAGGALCRNLAVSTVIGTIKTGTQISPTFDIPAPTFTCAGPPIDPTTDTTVDASGATVYPPGHYSAMLSINGTGNHKFLNGNYCFDNGVDVTGTANVIMTNANIRLDGGEFRTNGNGAFTCSNLLVYSAGGTGIHLNGNAANNCTGVTFYMQSGNVSWQGNVDQILKAPTGGPYKGLLIYIPQANGSQITINGSSGNDLTGSIIAPGSEIVISGVSGSSGYNTQIIGSHITLQGASNTTINFDASAQYNPPASPTIQLTK